MLNGQCSGICGGASFREERLTLAERGEMDVLKINDDDDVDDDTFISNKLMNYSAKITDINLIVLNQTNQMHGVIFRRGRDLESLDQFVQFADNSCFLQEWIQLKYSEKLENLVGQNKYIYHVVTIIAIIIINIIIINIILITITTITIIIINIILITTIIESKT